MMVSGSGVLRLGITGGIGSGKTVVSRLLGVLGIPVYISDVEARRLMVSDPVIRRGLVELIGPDAYEADGGLCKARVASYLFASADNASRVNGIVHPRVREDFRRWTAHQVEGVRGGCRSEATRSVGNHQIVHEPVVGMESAILLEAGFRSEVDRVVVVTAPPEVRIARAMLRDAATRQAVERRIRAQMAEEERCGQADFVVCNDGVRPLIPQVVELVRSL